jgi:hypothetical protein
VGINGVARAITQGYVGVEGVSRIFYPSKTVQWEKYDCIVRSIRHNTYIEVTSRDGYSIGDITNLTLKPQYYLSDGYTFYTSVGLYLESPFHTFSSVTMLDHYSPVGKLTTGRLESGTTIYQILSVDSIDIANETYTVTCKIVALADVESFYYTYEYRQGSTLYDIIEVQEGALPEDGTLVEGSTSTYLVLRIGETYYYYIRHI